MTSPTDPDLDQFGRIKQRRRWVRRIVGTYGALSALWILLSDLAIEAIIPSNDGARTTVSMVKGWGFVAATAALLAFWLRRYALRIDASTEAVTALHRRTKENEQRWILALESTGQGVWDWDAVTNVGFRSPSWSTMLGYRDGEIAPNPDGWLDLVHPDDLRAVIDAAAKTADDGNDHCATEHRMRRADGTYCWVLDRSTVIERFDDGRPKRVLGVQIDITHQREAIAELDAHRLRLADLVVERTLELEVANRSLLVQIEEVADLYNNAPCGYHSIGPDATILAMNDTELRWLGYERDEVVGRMQITALLTAASRERFADTFPRFVAGGTVADVDFEFVRKDGSLLPAVLSSTAIRDAHGNFTGSRSTVFDNRERRARERHVALLNAELVKRAEDAEQASRAKSNFLATMSHEMRTPLNAIVGFSHVLEREVADPTVKDRLRKVHAAAGHLAEIINDVLDLSKIEAGKLRLQAVTFSPASAIDDAVTLVSAQAAAKSITVSIDIDTDLPVVVRGDPTRFEQAVLNYLSNAVKFTDGSVVKVRVKRLRAAADQVAMRVEVVDHGPGISPDALRRLFTRFEQGDASTTRRHGGTGLGLVITRQLAQAMGGEAGALSTPGIGSTFWFNATFGTEAAGEGDETDAPFDVDIDETAWDAHVLVVEDNDLNQEVVLDLLRQFGVTADVASSGTEALAIAREFAQGGTIYDLVLMDIQMPEMDGFEATRQLRGCPTYGQVPIVAMTAGVFTSDRHESSDAGMDDHLSKPIDPRQLARVLYRWLPATTRRATTQRDATAGGRRVGGIDDAAERVLDVPTGLSYCSGVEEVYVSRLIRWLGETVPLTARLGTVRSWADVVGLRAEIHLLVSSAGYLGARDVSTLASRFESILAAEHDAVITGVDVAPESDLATAAGMLADALTLVRSQAASLFPEAIRRAETLEGSEPRSNGGGHDGHEHDNPIDAAATVADAMVTRRDEIQELLRADDATASRYLDTHYRELASVFAVDHPSFDAFVAQVHRFDFAAALDTLEKALLDQPGGTDHPVAPE